MQQDAIKELLPHVVARTAVPGGLLAALLGLMEELHAPAEAALADLDAHFAPYRAPDRFVPFLAHWVSLGWLLAEDPTAAAASEAPALASGMGPLRELVAAGAELAKWRGTSTGLVRFLEIATGVPGFTVAPSVGEDGTLHRFRLQVLAPADAAPYEELVRRIVAHEKPAYMQCDIVFADAAGEEDES